MRLSLVTSHCAGAALAVLAGLCVAGAAPAAATSTLAQKAGAAGCLGPDVPCGLGIGLGNARSVQVSPDGRNAYVAAALSGTLTTFDRTADGTLRQKSGPAGCLSSSTSPMDAAQCPRATALDTPWSVAVSPDGRNVYVASLASDAVAVFDRAADGRLTQKAGLAGCVADAGAGPCTAAEGLLGARAVTVSPDGRSVYAASADANAVAVLDRAADGGLTPKAGLAGCVSSPESGDCTPARGLLGATAVATSPDGANVYVVSGEGVAVFDRAGDGTLTQKPDRTGCITETGTAGVCLSAKALNTPTSVTVSPDGASVYVASAGSAAVAVFDRVAGGALAPKPGAAACISGADTGGACERGRGLAEAQSVTVSPDGISVYVTSRTDRVVGDVLFDGDGYVAVFDRSATGELTQPVGAAGCVTEDGSDGLCIDAEGVRGPTALAVSPDGRHAYVAAFGEGAIAAFDRVPVSKAPATPAADVTRPVLSGLALRPARFRAAARGGSVVKRGGGRISFRLSEPASVRFTAERVVPGRRSGARCVAVRPANRSAKPCLRYVKVLGGFTKAGAKGAGSLRFSGRLRSRKLAAGRYRLRAVATDAARNASRAQVAGFTILRR